MEAARQGGGDDDNNNNGAGQIFPRNEYPSFMVAGLISVSEFFQQYGWIFMLAVVVSYFTLNKLKPSFQNWQKKREDDVNRRSYDPDKAYRQLEAMEQARERMQRQMDTKAAKYAEEMKKKEEEQLKRKIEDWERHKDGKGYRSKVRVNHENSLEAELMKRILDSIHWNAAEKESAERQFKPKQKPSPRSSDYNPLMGGGGGISYRPPRRGGGG